MATVDPGPVPERRPGPVVTGPDPLERELRRMAVLQRRAIVQRRRTTRRPRLSLMGARAL